MNLVARPATASDSAQLLSWRNDPLTLKQSRESKPVAADTHEAWLATVLSDSTRYLFIVESEDGVPLGTVRFDPESANTYEVSITVNPEHRGRKYSKSLLLCAEEQLKRNAKATSLHAFIKEDNAASVRLFESAGYTHERDTWWIKRLESDV